MDRYHSLLGLVKDVDIQVTGLLIGRSTQEDYIVGAVDANAIVAIPVDCSRLVVEDPVLRRGSDIQRWISSVSHRGG